MVLARKSLIAPAVFALISVLFMQLAVAAYACPTLQTSGQMTGITSASSDAATMPGCDETDPGQPSVCYAHCQYGKQSLDKAELAPVHPAVTTYSSVVAAEASAPRRPLYTFPLLLARATAPPLAIRNCCFRI